jgi:hypothetical protein
MATRLSIRRGYTAHFLLLILQIKIGLAVQIKWVLILIISALLKDFTAKTPKGLLRCLVFSGIFQLCVRWCLLGSFYLSLVPASLLGLEQLRWGAGFIGRWLGHRVVSTVHLGVGVFFQELGLFDWLSLLQIIWIFISLVVVTFSSVS